MLDTGLTAGTGSMAAVAGVVAQELMPLNPQVVVENGGDIYLALAREATVGLWAGKFLLSGRLGLKLAAAMPCAICTSSGTVGPSLSLGRADAATIVAKDGALTDASALGNRVQSRGDLAAAVAVLGDRLAAWGEIELAELRG